tara:strand:+ start:1431 stop:1592 length:162 start_codon:yes stop_codon:yes gene_type:complete
LLLPVRKIKLKGRTGYQWGKRGKVYTGAGAKEKAAAQGAAARRAGYREKRPKR